MIGELQIITEDSSAIDSDDGFDDVDEIGDSDNRLEGRWSAGKLDVDDSLLEYPIASDRSLAGIKGQWMRLQGG